MKLLSNRNVVGREFRIAIVSPYPPPKEKHVYGSGVISYTKNLVNALKDVVLPNIKIFVVADKHKGIPHVYREDRVYVIRCFSKNVLYIFQIFKQLCRIKPNIVHIQHEYFLYGGLLSATLFPLLVLFSRLVAEKVVITLHHGVFPLSNIDNRDFRKENGLKGPALLLKLGLLTITKMIALFAHKVIVHELFMKKYLVTDYKISTHKIKIIPHGVEDVKQLPKEESKRKLGLEGKTVLLYFGYLTGYKGLKELLDAYRDVAKKIPNTVLVIAGGPHPRLIREKWYRDWIRDLVKEALAIQWEIKDRGKIVFTGYVPEDEIPLYFSVADIVVLPYKARIAASGPEALAIAFERCYVIESVGHKNTYTLSSSITSALLSIEACRNRSADLKILRAWSNVARQHLRIYLGQDLERSDASKVKAVLMIAPEYPPHNIGGGGIVVQNIARELSRKGYNVVVVAGYYKSKSLLEKPWIEKDGDVYVTWFPLVPTPKNLPYLDTVMPPNIYSTIFLFKILRGVKRLRNCVVHLHGYGHLLVDYAALLLRVFRKPYILTIHGIPKSPLYLGKRLLKYAFLLYTKLIGRRTVEGATKVTAISRAIAKEAIAYGARPSQIVVIPNGIDPNYAINVKQGEFRKKYGIPLDKKIILCIGRLHPRKGFQYVIAAMPRILREEPNAVLVIVGDGPYRRVLEALAKKLGVERNVIFTGYVNEQAKKEALADADVVVIPSLIEPFGLVALEAMAMGRPIIASNIDGLRDFLIHEVNALLIPPTCTSCIIASLLSLLRDSSKSKALCKNATKTAITYSWDRIVSRYIELYVRVIEK